MKLLSEGFFSSCILCLWSQQSPQHLAQYSASYGRTAVQDFCYLMRKHRKNWPFLFLLVISKVNVVQRIQYLHTTVLHVYFSSCLEARSLTKLIVYSQHHREPLQLYSKQPVQTD